MRKPWSPGKGKKEKWAERKNGQKGKMGRKEKWAKRKNGQKEKMGKKGKLGEMGGMGEMAKRAQKVEWESTNRRQNTEFGYLRITT